MSKIRIYRAIFFSPLVLALTGCAQVGSVHAPSAGLPQPVHDFHATRLGPRVQLQFTPPTATSDGAGYAVAKFGPIHYQLCAWPGVENGFTPPAPAPPLAGAGTPVPPQVPSRHPPQPGVHGLFPIPSGARMPSCPQLLTVTGNALPLDSIAAHTPLVTLALAAENGDGNWAGWSNPVTIPITPVTPPPQLDSIQLTPQGVRLNWKVPHPEPRSIVIYRQSATTPAAPIARVPGANSLFLDTSVAWNQTYTYWLRSSAGAGPTAAQSADSRHLLIRTADVFPPPVPSGLQAVPSPSGNGIDLSWNPVSALDLAGYNVYRRLPGSSTWHKRNTTPLPTSVFHDELPPGAREVEYAVTAIDAAGNESQRSLPVSAATRF